MKNRELKFRIWDAQYKRFVKGYENKNHYDELYSDPPGLIFGGLAYLNEYGEYYTIQQWTGLKDKNGKEIYEGDILLDDTKIPLRCYYDNGKFMAGASYASQEWFFECEIIGNIFENKDLLK